MKHNHYEEAARHSLQAAKRFNKAHRSYNDGNDEELARHLQAGVIHSGKAKDHVKEAVKMQLERQMAIA